MKVDKLSIIRTIILIIALVNQMLTAYGYSILPISDDQVDLLISTIFTIVTALWAWWKNNYLSYRGKRQKQVLQQHDLYKP